MITSMFAKPVRLVVGCAAVILAIGAGRAAFASHCCGGGGHEGQEGKQAEPVKNDAAIIAEQLPTYPMTTCPVSGDKLGGEMGEPFDYVYKGRLVRFCCKGCVKEFSQDPAKYLAKIDAAAKEKGDGKAKD